MAPVVIYGAKFSGACRILLMTCEVLELEYEFKVIDFKTGEHLTPEYKKINPHHTIPTLVDGDFITNESRPAAAYLINKYGGEKKKQLYPDDPETRCRVDQRMYFEMGTIYKSMSDCTYPLYARQADEFPADKVTRLYEVLEWVHDYVKDTFAAGTDHLTLADICFVASLTTIIAIDILDVSKFNPAFNDYLNKCKKLIPNYESANGEGIVMLEEWFKSIKASIKK